MQPDTTLFRSGRFAALALLSTLFLTLVAPAAWAAKPRQDDGRTVVLVHGAFADGSGWGPVIRLLQAEGVKVVSVQNPLSSLADDVAATHRVVNQQAGQVVLVGHSWGGMVITEAGTHPKVDALVYVAAFSPDVGMTVSGMLEPYPPAAWLADLVADEAGNLTLNESGFLRYFAPDVPAGKGRVLWSVQVPAAQGTLIDPSTQAAWKTRPAWYVLAEQDQIINPDLQRVMSARMNARVTTLRSGHLPMLSNPARVVSVILAAVRAADR